SSRPSSALEDSGHLPSWSGGGGKSAPSGGCGGVWMVFKPGALSCGTRCGVGWWAGCCRCWAWGRWWQGRGGRVPSRVAVRGEGGGGAPTQQEGKRSLRVWGKFKGGTGEQSVTELQRAADPSPINVVLPASGRDLPMPPIELRNVGVPTAIEAAQAAAK